MTKIKTVLAMLFAFYCFASSQSVLILEDGGTQDSVYSILTGDGISTTRGGAYGQYTGAGISQYSVIIFLNGRSYTSYMPDSVQTKIRNFVSSGGGLLTTEWISYYASRYAILSQALPVVYNGGYSSGRETYRKMLDHPITLSLPDSFQTSPNWNYSYTKKDTATAKHAQTIYTGSRSGDAVVLGQYGSGKAIHWNTAGHYGSANIWDANTKKLLLNMVRYLLSSISVEKAKALPAGLNLEQNHPNPFNASTLIRYRLDHNGPMTLKVFDLAGREVATLVSGMQKAGDGSVKFNATRLPNGIYCLQLNANNTLVTKKMIFLR